MLSDRVPRVWLHAGSREKDEKKIKVVDK